MTSHFRVVKNKLALKTLECVNRFDPQQTATIRHDFPFFPISGEDVICLPNELVQDLSKPIVLRTKPVVIVDLTKDRINNIFRYLLQREDKPDSRSATDQLVIRNNMEALIQVALSYIKYNVDNPGDFYESILVPAEASRLDQLEEVMLTWIQEYQFDQETGDRARLALPHLAPILADALNKKIIKRRLTMLNIDPYAAKNGLEKTIYGLSEMYRLLIQNQLIPLAFAQWDFQVCSDLAIQLGWYGQDNIDEARVDFEFHKALTTYMTKFGNLYMSKTDFEKAVAGMATEISCPCEILVEKLTSIYGLQIIKDRVYTHDLYQIEYSVLDFLVERIENNRWKEIPSNVPCPEHLNEQQSQAFQRAMSQHISILTGGAGTGKTRTVSAIVQGLLESGLRVQCTSFTGKAVARMEELIEQSSRLSASAGQRSNPLFLRPMTMDKLLSLSLRPIFDYLIIDEASMITVSLFARFVREQTFYFRILLVGDINQLQPIGLGEMFKILFKTCAIPVTRLQQNFRSTTKGEMLPNIAKIESGRIDLTYSQPGSDDGNFYLIPTQSLNESYDYVRRLLLVLQDQGMTSKQIRILSCFREPLDRLNAMMIETFFGKGKTFSPGQEVLLNQNFYEYNIFNGTPGRIIESNHLGAKVLFDGQENAIHFVAGKVEKNQPNMANLDHAYCTTVHKSQGSEYKTVILFCPHLVKNPKQFLNNNLFYTAVSRAKDCLYIIGDASHVEMSMKTYNKPKLEFISEQIREYFKISEKYVEYIPQDPDQDEDEDDYY